MTDRIPDRTPAPEDVQAFAECMTAAGASDGLAEAALYARQGYPGMALHVAYQAAQRAGNRAARERPAEALTAGLDAAIAALVGLRAALVYGPPLP